MHQNIGGSKVLFYTLSACSMEWSDMSQGKWDVRLNATRHKLSLIGEVVQSRRRPLLGPSPG